MVRPGLFPDPFACEVAGTHPGQTLSEVRREGVDPSACPGGPEAYENRFGGVVAPPAMLQTWTMPRPRIEGIAERGGAPTEMSGENVVSALDKAGYVGTLATNSELEFERYLRPGDRLHLTNELESISARKKTGLGLGYFVTWITTYLDANDEVVGKQLFRIFKFDPATMGGAG